MPSDSFVISYIEGDGVGPELFRAARRVLDAISESFDLEFEYQSAPAGDKQQKRTGKSLPKRSLETIKDSDACLKAPVGESARNSILKIRQELDLYANIRPVQNLPFVKSKFAMVDLVIVRENTEDFYICKESVYDHGSRAIALKVITKKASARIARRAFDLVLSRNKSNRSVVCVSKSNVLPKTDGLFVKSCAGVARKFPSVSFSHMYVDAAAMNLIRNPESFDVIVTTNLYGDILSDEASQLVGGLGLAPSANLGDSFGLFEPVHGSAPDIAGKGIANPLAILLSVKMMLDWLGTSKRSENCTRASDVLLNAVCAVGESGIMTPDIGGSAMTDQVAKKVSEVVCQNSLKKHGNNVPKIESIVTKTLRVRE